MQMMNIKRPVCKANIKNPLENNSKSNTPKRAKDKDNNSQA